MWQKASAKLRTAYAARIRVVTGCKLRPASAEAPHVTFALKSLKNNALSLLRVELRMLNRVKPVGPQFQKLAVRGFWPMLSCCKGMLLFRQSKRRAHHCQLENPAWALPQRHLCGAFGQLL